MKEASSSKHADPKVQRQKAAFLMNQFESPEAKEFMVEVDERWCLRTLKQISNFRFKNRLSKSVREMMLPNHLLDVVDFDEIGDKKKSVETIVDYDKILVRLRDIKQFSKNQQGGVEIFEVGDKNVEALTEEKDTNVKTYLAEDGISMNGISAALVHFSTTSVIKTIVLFNTIKDLKLFNGLSEPAIVSVMRAYISKGSYKNVNQVFDSMISEGISPSAESWEVKIQSTARSRDPDAALAILDRIVKAGIEPTCAMYD
jgi:pentatricopeptide repeat protein